MDLKTRAIKSTAWYAATRLWIQAVSWGLTVILARLLAPQDYGLFAMALTVIAFLELFQEFGLGVAIIQRQDLTRAELNTIFWILSATSLVLASLAFVSAGFVARFYGEPRLLWMTRLLSIGFLLNSLGMVPYNLLTKDVDFRRRSLGEAYGTIASAVVSISLAYLEYGVWALVSGYLLNTAVRNISMFLFCGWFPGMNLSFSRMSEVVKFGLFVSGASGLWGLSLIVNNAIIGRFLGGHALGLYSMAQTLGMNSIHKLSTALINQVSLPVFSKLQHDDEQLRWYLLKITKYLAIVCLPMQLGMVLVAHDAVLVLLSEKWLPVVWLFQVFTIGGIFYVLPLPSGPLLMARGRARTVFKFSAISSVVMAIALFIATQFGLATVAIAWLLVFAPVRLCGLALGLWEIDLTMKTYLDTIRSPFLATATMTAVVVLLGTVFPDDFGPLTRMVVSISVGALTYVVMLLRDKTVSVELKGLAQTLFARRLPSEMRA